MPLQGARVVFFFSIHFFSITDEEYQATWHPPTQNTLTIPLNNTGPIITFFVLVRMYSLWVMCVY